jgi:hypothetical protein
LAKAAVCSGRLTAAAARAWQASLHQKRLRQQQRHPRSRSQQLPVQVTSPAKEQVLQLQQSLVELPAQLRLTKPPRLELQ